MEDTKYKVSVVKLYGKTLPFVCANKCSALVALTNFSYLNGRSEVAANRIPDTIDQKLLTSKIVTSIENYFRRTIMSNCQEDDFKHLARSLQRQISLNPINSECNKFDYTNEFNLFKLLGVTVLHGWVLDPKDQNFKSVAGWSYNSMVELSALNTPSSTSSSDVQAAKSFMNASKHQFTTFGLQQLHSKVEEQKLAVLYAENDFNLLYKHDGDLFVLEVSEDKLKQLPTGVWKKLAVEEEDSFYVTHDFSPTKGQPEEKYRLANEWFMGKLSAFDDDKKPTKKKKKSKRGSTKGVAKDSTAESILHISDVDQSEGSLNSEAVGLASQQSFEEPSASVTSPTTAEKFCNFLMEFRDESGALYFENAVREMIRNSFMKLYVPFSSLQNYDGNLAIEIQDGYPRIHDELKQSVADFIIKCDSSVAAENVELEIQNLPTPKWNQKFLQFTKENEMINTYLLYDGTKDNTPTLIGNDMALGYLHQVLDTFEELKGWSEVEKSEEGDKFTEGWSTQEMEVRDNATKFVITKKADVELTQDVAMANLFTYVRHVFSCFLGTDLKLHPAFFDTFATDILLCPEPKKDSLKWKRFLKYMRSPLAFKVSLVRSTLMTEFHTVLSLEIMLTPFDYSLITRSGTRRDWRTLVIKEKPFSDVYSHRTFGVWEASHWNVVQFSRHFVVHVLAYLKKMRFLHDIGIVELMLARHLEYFIADTVRTIVMEYGVDQVFSSAWGHFEGSNSTTMPLQNILQVTSSSDTTLEQIDKLVIRLPAMKSGGCKLPAHLEIDISSQKRVLQLLDIKKHLESKDISVEKVTDDVTGEDCIEIRMIVNAEGRKLALHSPFCAEYNTVLEKLHELLVEDEHE